MKVLLFICIIYTTVYNASAFSEPESNVTHRYQICETKECQRLAKHYKEHLDFSVSPCDDFLTYTCGKYNEKTKIKDTDVDSSITRILRDKTRNQVIELLGKPIIEMPENSTETARAFYQGCVQSENISAEVMSSQINHFLTKIGGMPLIPSTNYNSKMEWELRVAKVYRFISLDLFIGFKAGVNPQNATEKLLLISQMTKFGIPVVYLLGKDADNKKIIAAYKKFMKSSVCVLRNDKCGNSSKIDKDIDKIINFEKEIAKITMLKPGKNSSQIFGSFKLPVSKVKKYIPEIDWHSYLKNVFKETGIQINETTKTYVLDPAYFQEIANFINKSDPETVANYIGWRVFQVLPAVFTKVLRNDTFEFGNLLSGYYELPDVKKACVSYTIAHFPFSVGRLYVDSYFKSKIKDDVEDLIIRLKKSIKKLLKKVEWMDDATKKEALKKLSTLDYEIAYPLWIKDDDELEDREGMSYTFDKEEFIPSVIKCYKNQARNSLHGLLRPKERVEWTKSPATVNAHYDATQNIIVFPAAILQPPIYQPNVVKSVNYGTIGNIIGHELTHGFEESGSVYDFEGNLRLWWSKNSSAKFKRIKECFINEFNITDKETNITLKGKKIVTENMADNGGIRAAYNAYMTNDPTDERLPGLETLNHKQLFFISFGMAWCGTYRYQGLRNAILKNKHPPYMYRVFMPPRNFKVFAETFNCPSGSKMNPTEKCELW